MKTGWYGIPHEPISLYERLGGDTKLTPGTMDFLSLHIPGHTPGSIAVVVKVVGQKVLFGQDLHRPFSDNFLSDLTNYCRSMNRLIKLGVDILCEGHFGIFSQRSRCGSLSRNC